MKISRFIVMAVFGLGLISQNAFSYSTKDNTDMTMKHDKVTCEKSAFPLFNKEENRPCKDGVKHEKKHAKKHVKKHDMCGEGCHKSVLPLFNKEENRPCVCDKDDTKTDKSMETSNKTMYKK